MIRNRRGCVVDGISTGRELERELHALGVTCAHINSTDHYASLPAARVDLSRYDTTFDGTGNVVELVARLRSWRPDFIVAGSEFGVQLCDVLSHMLEIPMGNHPLTTHLRRNKFRMHERLRETGLPSVAQAKVRSRRQLEQWLFSHDRYPVVIKPVDSACSDGVSICADRQEAVAAFGRIYLATNRLGSVNTEVLAQGFLDGTQYFVNTVSWDGRHYVTDIWLHDRRVGEHGRFLFENMTLQPRNGAREAIMADYIANVLNVLGLNCGASHCEVIWAGDGPTLVEVNARLMGASIDSAVFREALGYTQAELLARICADPGEFDKYDRHDYQLKAHVAEASFIFTRSGVLNGFPRRTDIEALPSFHSLVGVPDLGTRIARTDNTLGEPGFAYFLHPNRAQVVRDAQTVLAWQRADSVFEIKEAQ